MKTYIEVKVHAPTDTKGKRISCTVKGEKRQYFPWDYSRNYAENVRSAAEAFCQKKLNAAGYAIDTPVLTEYVSTKSGLPIGYVWE